MTFYARLLWIYPLAIGLLVSSPRAISSEPTLDNSAPHGYSYRKSRNGYADSIPRFGGRNSTGGELEDSDRELDPAFRFPAADEFYKPWSDWQKKQNLENGIQLSAHYSTMYQSLSSTINSDESDDDLDDDKASSGVFRGTLQWTPIGNGTLNSGSLNIMVDHRHAFRDLAPADLAAQAGYIGVTSLFYNDAGFMLVNLNWKQGFNNGNTGYIVGRFDPNDYMNVLGYVNPWSVFSNLDSNLDTTVALPDSSWGVAGGHWIDDQWYVLGGINDANGLGNDDLEFFEGGAEFFKYAHIGWTPGKEDRYIKNVHLLAWHVDEREEADLESAKGLALAANWTFNDRWMPFARIGLSTGSTPIYNNKYSIGLIRKFMYRSDLLGVSASWGSPPDDSLPDQKTFEAFWRFQLSQGLALTPSIQLLKDPAFNEEEDTIWVIGFRARFSL
jgi:porin